ncbi:flp pilus-assembly TadE/G-like family protein [Streptomyces sp. B-S-A8]|uniref:Flp pilus-assembly TadE/G-like family protein n=1 Tax=Streptomyces solicavernae TaxID=3043614 RepID=A0ABT6RYW0_9ACTN|nr:Rv3654c family TadE-like protein [Streptomyces sp. B-S-A8]MDI3389622.1 flp pilus-assembly TadE/G-like family protein [Streptomyces sp. B-S-A8]
MAAEVRPDGARRAAVVGRANGAPGHVADGERGSATVWAVMVVAALCVVFGAVLLLTQAVLARHRAGGAADLAALAAADRALRGTRAACATAERVAAEQGAEVVRCAVRGEIADVTVRARAGGFRAQLRARAGPPEAGPPEAGPPVSPGESPPDQGLGSAPKSPAPRAPP